MLLIDVVLGGIVLGGLYALVATGLNLQYGVARIMNLSYGELVVLAAFAAFGCVSGLGLSPFVALAIVPPVAFALSWAVYRWLMTPLVRRSPSAEALEADSILATFGLLFVIQGTALSIWGGNLYSYSYLAVPVDVLGSRIAANRLLAFAIAAALAATMWFVMHRTRIGTAVRAVAVDPVAAGLVAIDVPRFAAFSFALGGALVAAAGVLVSMFLTFTAGMGVVFTMKALIVVIMGGVGNVLGGFVAAILLGLAESVGGYLIDPGLTLAINFAMFLAVLLWRPTGLLGGR
ncbi:MAG: branched-chain amino acid ABC transporter permease [Rhodospirillales bacterium]